MSDCNAFVIHLLYRFLCQQNLLLNLLKTKHMLSPVTKAVIIASVVSVVVSGATTYILISTGTIKPKSA